MEHSKVAKARQCSELWGFLHGRDDESTLGSRTQATGEDTRAGPGLFYEYFDGENGAGLGASNQTGWTGLIARSLDLFSRLTPQNALRFSKDELTAQMTRDQVMGT